MSKIIVRKLTIELGFIDEVPPTYRHNMPRTREVVIFCVNDYNYLIEEWLLRDGRNY